jgi:hypothetical protein
MIYFSMLDIQLEIYKLENQNFRPTWKALENEKIGK